MAYGITTQGKQKPENKLSRHHNHAILPNRSTPGTWLAPVKEPLLKKHNFLFWHKRRLRKTTEEKHALFQDWDSSLSNFQLTVLKLKSSGIKMQREVPFCKRNSSGTTLTLFHPCYPEVKHKECHWSWHSSASTSQNCELTSHGPRLQCLCNETGGLNIVHTLPVVFLTKVLQCPGIFCLLFLACWLHSIHSAQSPYWNAKNQPESVPVRVENRNKYLFSMHI